MTGTWRRTFAERHGIVLLTSEPGGVTVGSRSQPSHVLLDWLATLYGCRPTVERLSEAGYAAALDALDLADTSDAATLTEADRLDLRETDLPPGEEALRRLLRDAIAARSSDLALWLADRWRWRVTRRTPTGLEHLTTLDREEGATVMRRLLVRAGLDPIAGAGVQDGTIAVPWLPNTVIRVASIDRGDVRALSLRFLHRSARPLGQLGFAPATVRRLTRALEARTGLIAFAGETGSGKSTTLAAAMRLLVARGRRVVSIEDPVESVVAGALQLDEASDPEIIAASLRQDPDVLVVGEVRRRRHGQAIRDALLSGHLVLTTIHVDSLDLLVTRLERAGVPARLAASRVRLMWHQRCDPGGARHVTTCEPWREGVVE